MYRYILTKNVSSVNNTGKLNRKQTFNNSYTPTNNRSLLLMNKQAWYLPCSRIGFQNFRLKQTTCIASLSLH